MQKGVPVIIAVVYLVIAAVVGALDTGSDTGSAIFSGLLWPLLIFEYVWGHMAHLFGPMFG